MLKPFLLLSAIALFPLSASALTKESEVPVSNVVQFEVTLRGESKMLTLEELDISLKEEEVTHEQKNLFTSLSSLKELVGLDNVELYGGNTENVIREKWSLSTPADASFIYEEGTLAIVDEVEGFDLDIDSFINDLEKDYPKLNSYVIDYQAADLLESETLEKHQVLVEVLLSKGLEISTPNGTYIFPAQLKDIDITMEDDSSQLVFNAPFMEYVLSSLEDLVNQDSQNLILTGISDEAIAHVDANGRVTDGLKVNRSNTQALIEASLAEGKNVLSASVETVEGELINESGRNLGPLELMATGKSNFVNSPSGRDYNVRKALNEHYNGILISPGAEFSFTDFLGPVTYSAGWQGGLAIIGGELIMVPGGGICQVSTTMYRAALDAGLEIKEQRNHSLYVSYYAAYGDGLDATIYPGSQDLVFVNDTNNYIFIEAYDDGYDAVINFYGEKDGRSTQFEGPYTTSNQTQELVDALGGLSSRQIAWKHIISRPDGSTEIEWLLSSYTTRVPQQ